MKKEIDWINVRKERRAKLIYVTQSDIESYVLVNKLPDVSVMNIWDLPGHWMVGGVQYDCNRGSFIFVILSPEYESMSADCEFDIVTAYRHVIKITRRVVSE